VAPLSGGAPNTALPPLNRKIRRAEKEKLTEIMGKLRAGEAVAMPRRKEELVGGGGGGGGDGIVNAAVAGGAAGAADMSQQELHQQQQQLQLQQQRMEEAVTAAALPGAQVPMSVAVADLVATDALLPYGDPAAYMHYRRAAPHFRGGRVSVAAAAAGATANTADLPVAYVENKGSGHFSKVPGGMVVESGGDLGAADNAFDMTQHSLNEYERDAQLVAAASQHIRGALNRLYLLASGFLAGMCAMQAVLVSSQSSDIDFLIFYSKPSASIRFWLYIFTYVCATLSIAHLAMTHRKRNGHHEHGVVARARVYLLLVVYGVAVIATMGMADADHYSRLLRAMREKLLFTCRAMHVL
jgi:hypothetical protein